MFMEDLDNVFDEDLGLDEVVEEVEGDIFLSIDEPESIFEEKVSLIPEESILIDLLKAKGIQNNKIIVIDDKNEESQVDFFSLSKQDQLEVLTSNREESPTNNDLEDSEITFINSLRTSNKSVEEFLEEYKTSVLAEASKNVEPSYDIDAYTDEELFILDLKNKYDLTDDELEKELEKELQDKDLFTKKITKTREEYKKLEDNFKQEQEQEFIRQKDTEYQGFVDTMVNVAVKTPELYGIQLEDAEKNEVLSLLLDLDDKGASEFYKKLNDPNTLYQAAWFLRYGKEAFDTIIDAYEAEISELKKDKPKVVVRKDTKSNNIHDLF
jgi:hypothetical protein